MQTESITNSSLVSLSKKCCPILSLHCSVNVFFNSLGVRDRKPSFFGRTDFFARRWWCVMLSPSIIRSNCCVSTTLSIFSESSTSSSACGVCRGGSMGESGNIRGWLISATSSTVKPSGARGPAGTIFLVKLIVADLT